MIQRDRQPDPVKVAETPDDIRQRTVKRYVAQCPYGSQCQGYFNERKPHIPHPTPAAAEVEAVRHIREVHRIDLSTPVKLVRRYRVSREIVGETMDE